MKEVFMKKGDIIIIVVVSIVSMALWLGFNLFQDTSNQKSVVIKSEGAIVAEIPIDATTSASYVVENKYGYNEIRIEDGKVFIHSADCKNQLCVTEGVIQEPGRSLICLPNRVVVEIVGKREDDVDVISH
jgi:hypothetical protein